MKNLCARTGLAGLVAIAGLAVAPSAYANMFTVNSTADTHDSNTADNVCKTATGTCTLRAAIDQANFAPDADVIVLPAGTYQLTGAAGENNNASGDLDITHPTTITGAGARTTKIVGTGGDRVLDYEVGSGDVDSLSGVTVTGGAGVDQGGGIFEQDGTLNVSNSSIVGNQVNSPTGTSNQGGGIFIQEQFNLTNVTIAGNIATRGASSPFPAQGGGLFDNGSPPSTLVNVTMSDNQANGVRSQGGGVFYNASANTETWTNVTLAGNSVSGSGAEGGGIFVNDQITMKNTIIALNRFGAAQSNCFLNDVLHSAGHNLEEGTDCSFTAGGDLRNTNPLLGSLANNGGQVDTRALLTGSPAIDAASSSGCPATDARGVSRPQGAGCDIGAYEFALPTSSRPGSSGCTKPAGKLAGKQLGFFKLGMKLRRAEQIVPRFRRIRFGFIDFCLTPRVGLGIRVQVPSKRLLSRIAKNKRKAVRGRIVIALTNNPFYSLHGVRPGTNVKQARHKLRLGRAFFIGVNTWYIVPGRTANGLLKVRHGIIEEVGIANKQFSSGNHKNKFRFLTSWKHVR